MAVLEPNDERKDVKPMSKNREKRLIDHVNERVNSPMTRRSFVLKSSLSSITALIGSNIVFGNLMPKNYQPVALLESLDAFPIKGKHDELVVLNDKPWNIETPAHLLDDRITPGDKMFVRNNGIPPEKVDPNTWLLKISGESVQQEKSYSIADLKSKFKQYSYQLVLECGGNGRAEFNPPAKGNQWTTGAVSCAKWTGVRLRDVLQDAGIKKDAVYVAYYGADLHLSGDPDKKTISRGVPIQKALEDEALIAWAMNDKDIPFQNGHPLRLVFGGWPASTSGKWLNEILIRNKIHDGPKMTGQAYRVPCKPVEPGQKVDDKDMCIIENMPVKSLITYPKSGGMLKLEKSLEVRGHAWAGDRKVVSMEVSIDFGSTWQKVNLEEPANRNAWQHWKTSIKFPQKGYYEIWAKATDDQGQSQPMVVPGWNPKGYLNNACHRIAVKIV